MSERWIWLNTFLILTFLCFAIPSGSMAQTGSDMIHKEESRERASTIQTSGSQSETHKAKGFVLEDGAVVKLKLSRDLSSSKAEVEETVDFEVIEDVKVDGVVVIQRGAKAEGLVIDARAARRMGRSGSVGIRLDGVFPVTGDRLPLRAISARSDGSRSGKVASNTTIAATFFFPAAPFFLLMKGKEVTIPKGTLVTSFIDGDHRLDREDFLHANEKRP